MADRFPKSASSDRLREYAAADAPASQRLLESIVESFVLPVIRRVAIARLRNSDDIDDVCSEALLRLLPRITSLRERPPPEAIDDLEAYTGVVAAHACAAHLRARFPLRVRLRNRLRYVLDSRDELSVWREASGTLFCGLASWNATRRATRAPRLDRLGHVPDGADPTTEILRALSRVGAPVPFEELVEAAAESWGIRDRPPIQRSHDRERDVAENLPDPRPDAAADFEHRAYLQALWREILDLPVRQRVALLLNLRDRLGNGVVALLPITGIATIREIAGAVEVPIDRFAAMWNDLPYEDNAVAELLGVTRQQVINLRKSARDRIARRMRHV